MKDKEKIQEIFDLLCKIRDILDIVDVWKYVGDDYTDAMVKLMELADYDIDPDNYKRL